MAKKHTVTQMMKRLKRDAQDAQIKHLISIIEGLELTLDKHFQGRSQLRGSQRDAERYRWWRRQFASSERLKLLHPLQEIFPFHDLDQLTDAGMRCEEAALKLAGERRRKSLPQKKAPRRKARGRDH